MLLQPSFENGKQLECTGQIPCTDTWKNQGSNAMKCEGDAWVDKLMCLVTLQVSLALLKSLRVSDIFEYNCIVIVPVPVH